MEKINRFLVWTINKKVKKMHIHSMKKNKKPIFILYLSNIMSMRQTKEMRKKNNQEKLLKSINLIESLLKDYTIPKSIKNSMKEILSILRDERNGEISVRVANAISLMENMTQNHHLQSHIRTNIWQLISTLESIRE